MLSDEDVFELVHSSNTVLLEHIKLQDQKIAKLEDCLRAFANVVEDATDRYVYSDRTSPLTNHCVEASASD
jgi:hypothetical protein